MILYFFVAQLRKIFIQYTNKKFRKINIKIEEIKMHIILNLIRFSVLLWLLFVFLSLIRVIITAIVITCAVCLLKHSSLPSRAEMQQTLKFWLKLASLLIQKSLRLICSDVQSNENHEVLILERIN